MPAGERFPASITRVTPHTEEAIDRGGLLFGTQHNLYSSDDLRNISEIFPKIIAKSKVSPDFRGGGCRKDRMQAGA
jgi:hypothetical protein